MINQGEPNGFLSELVGTLAIGDKITVKSHILGGGLHSQVLSSFTHLLCDFLSVM